MAFYFAIINTGALANDVLATNLPTKHDYALSFVLVVSTKILKQL